MAKQKTEKQKGKAERKDTVSILPSGERFYVLLIFAFSFLLYFNSVFNDYNMDDELVTQHHRLTSKGISAIPEIFSSPYYEDKAGYKYEYRPIVLVSFAIENSVFGERAGVSHFINVLWYALLCVLLFSVLRMLLKKYSIIFPFLITMLFAAHPVHTEVVASIKNRDEIFSLLFGLLCLRFAFSFSQKKNLLHLPVMLFFFLLGVLSKTTAITFVLLIPLALVLLTEISLPSLLLITLTLALPTVFFARLYSIAQQIGLLVLLLTAPIVFYYLKHSSELFVSFKNFVKNSYKQIKVKEVDAPVSRNTLSTDFYENKLLLILVVLGIAVVFSVGAFGVYAGNRWLVSLPLAALVLLFAFTRREMQLLLITPVSLMVVSALVKFHLDSTLLETSLVVFLGTLLFQDNKIFRIVALVNFGLYALATGAMNHSFFFITTLAFAGLLHKRTYLLTLFILLFSVAFFAKALIFKFSNGQIPNLSFVSLPLIYVAVFMVWKNKTKWLPVVSVLIMPVLVLLYFNIAAVSEVDVAEGFRKNYSAVTHVRAADLTPVQTVRPFNFIEIPIRDTDPFRIKLGTAMLVLGKYLKLVFVPYPMSFYYGYSYISPVDITGTIPLLSLIAHLGLLITALFFFRKIPLLAFSILFYLIAISVFSNLFLLVPGMMGDRFLLIPSIGFCFFVVFILSLLFKQQLNDKLTDWKVLNQPFKISVTVILVIYSLLTFSRNTDWKDRITLFRHDIKTVENSAQAQNLLALHLMLASSKEPDAVKQKKMHEEALVHFKRAVEIYPKFLNATFDRGRLLEAMGRYDEALVAFTEATLIDTTFTAPYFTMGVIHQNKGRQKEAAECYEKYLVKHPQQMEVYANLSYAYFMQQQFDKSIATNQRALAVMPGAFDATVNIAKTYKQMGQADSALYYLEKAQLIRPNDPNVVSVMVELKNKK